MATLFVCLCVCEYSRLSFKDCAIDSPLYSPPGSRQHAALARTDGGSPAKPTALQDDMATQQPAARSKLRSKKSESVDESDESFPRSAEKPAVAKPAALTQTQVYLNFGLVGTSCTIAQGTVHWTQTTMVRQQL